MIESKKIIAVIPARGGSKGVPRKNILEVGGRPLIMWSIEAARSSKYIDRIVVSSDDDEILDVVRTNGIEVPFKRPSELARDETPGIEPVLHAITIVSGFDIVVLLQPTSPLRESLDIDKCIEELISTGAPSCVSVCDAECHPYLVLMRQTDGTLKTFFPDVPVTQMRRQDFPPAFRLNGAVYVARIPWLLDSKSFVGKGTAGYVMPTSRSLDIDTFEDISIANAVLSH